MLQKQNLNNKEDFERASKMLAELFIAQIDEKNRERKINKNYKIKKYENTNT